MSNKFECFCNTITEISKCLHKIASDEMEQYGLSGSHAVYLITLREWTEGITAAKLSEICGKNKSDVSRMMSVLEKKGLVKRVHVHKNFYRALLKLTDEGRKAAEHVKANVDTAVEFVGRGISEEDRAIYYHVLEQITSNLQMLCEEGIPTKGK